MYTTQLLLSQQVGVSRDPSPRDETDVIQTCTAAPGPLLSRVEVWVKAESMCRSTWHAEIVLSNCILSRNRAEDLFVVQQDRGGMPVKLTASRHAFRWGRDWRLSMSLCNLSGYLKSDCIVGKI